MKEGSHQVDADLGSLKTYYLISGIAMRSRWSSVPPPASI